MNYDCHYKFLKKINKEVAPMTKYICCPRRGWKTIDESGQVIRNDWEYCENNDPNYIKPQLGELVIEFETNLKTGNTIPRIKFGDGIHKFTDLPYMSADSFILPKQISVTLYGSEDTANSHKPQWEEEVDAEGNFLGRYKQLVTIDNAVVTANSKIDLNPTPEMLAIFHEKDIAFVAENEDGVVTVYCVGQKPQNTYKAIPVPVTEVVLNG